MSESVSLKKRCLVLVGTMAVSPGEKCRVSLLSTTPRVPEVQVNCSL